MTSSNRYSFLVDPYNPSLASVIQYEPPFHGPSSMEDVTCRILNMAQDSHAELAPIMIIYIPIYLSTYLPIYLSGYLSIHPSIHPSSHFSVPPYTLEKHPILSPELLRISTAVSECAVEKSQNATDMVLRLSRDKTPPSTLSLRFFCCYCSVYFLFSFPIWKHDYSIDYIFFYVYFLLFSAILFCYVLHCFAIVCLIFLISISTPHERCGSNVPTVMSIHEQMSDLFGCFAQARSI